MKSAGKAYKLGRVILLGPGVLITAIAVMAGMTVWLPKGEAHVDHMVFSVVLFPAIWVGIFLYSYLDLKLLRGTCVLFLISLVNLSIAYLQFIRFFDGGTGS